MALVNPARSPSAGAEREVGIIGVLAGVGVSERRQKKRARVRAHVHTVGDKGDRAKHQAADNLRDHHDAAEPDDRPRPALAFFVSLPRNTWL